jgi:hypothetical protein
MTRPCSAADQIELFASEPQLPPGFAYRDEVITAAEERALVEQIVELPKCGARCDRAPAVDARERRGLSVQSEYLLIRHPIKDRER